MFRFCTETYTAPNPKNFHKVMSHLTNYRYPSTYLLVLTSEPSSLNKRSAQFDHGADGEETSTGSKRLLSGVVEALEAEAPHTPHQPPLTPRCAGVDHQGGFL